MRNTNVDELLSKYLADNISMEEMKQLLEYLRHGHGEELQFAIDNALQDGRFSSLAEKGRPDIIFKNIMRAAETSELELKAVNENYVFPKRIFPVSARWAAAVIAIIFALGGYFVFKNPGNANIAQQLKSPGNYATAFTRNLSLPDGSTVVLKANSTLEYPPVFSGATREVSLTGEAYFDIRHDDKKLFIIHTGTVKTTVLGTAFNIKALPGTSQVTVSVARGKVKVENETKIIAVLLRDQQVVYSTATTTITQKQVNTNKIITDWTTQDMVFESVPMGEIMQTLDRRYDVNIIIKSPALLQCQVKVSFSGTETLKNVLAALCTLTNSTLTEDGKGGMLIDGEGCQ
jgi:transmembrane sensor